MSLRTCPVCEEINGDARVVCRRCGAALTSAAEVVTPSVDIPAPDPDEESPRPFGIANDFRGRVEHTVLMERLVPPYRPPRTEPHAALAVVLFGFTTLILVLAVLALPSGGAFLLLLLSISVGVGGWAIHRAAIRRRAKYVLAHSEAYEMAGRLLSGRRTPGDSELALQAINAQLLKLQEPERGSWFFFVWWSE